MFVDQSSQKKNITTRRSRVVVIWTHVFLETRLINKHKAFDFVILSYTSGVKITTEF